VRTSIKHTRRLPQLLEQSKRHSGNGPSFKKKPREQTSVQGTLQSEPTQTSDKSSTWRCSKSSHKLAAKVPRGSHKLAAGVPRGVVARVHTNWQLESQVTLRQETPNKPMAVTHHYPAKPSENCAQYCLVRRHSRLIGEFYAIFTQHPSACSC
jgi:hypothetical protein